MLVLTVPTIQNGKINIYHGLVCGEAILGANVFRDISAKVRDIVGGRSVAYEEELRRAKDFAVEEMVAQATKLGANAVVGVDIDYGTVGGTMLMVNATGTTVVYAKD